MSLIVKKKIGREGLLGIWQLDGSEEDFFQKGNFSPEEIKAISAMHSPQRKMQWAATRMMLARLTGLEDPQIHYDSYRKPFLKNSDLKISISHSYEKVALILEEKQETGIDIELIKPKIERIAHKFMSKKELDGISPNNRMEQLYVHWCAKEALYKLYEKKELLFIEHLFIEPFEYKKGGTLKGKIYINKRELFFDLVYEKNEDHMLVYVTYN